MSGVYLLYGNAKRFDVQYVRQDRSVAMLKVIFFMANIYYDCPEMLPSIAPFLGVALVMVIYKPNLPALDLI